MNSIILMQLTILALRYFKNINKFRIFFLYEFLGRLGLKFKMNGKCKVLYLLKMKLQRVKDHS